MRRLPSKVFDYTATAAKVAIAIAGVSIAASLSIIAMRSLGYPLPIDFMEGGLVLETRRILTGQALYTAPSLSYTPFIYPPGYFVISAAISAVTGLGYFPLRLASTLATVCSISLLAYLLYYETEELIYSVIGVTLFISTYELTNGWFFVARPDMLFISILMIGLVVARTRDSMLATIAATVCFAAAFWTKQSGLIPLVLFGAYVYVQHPRKHFASYAVTAGLLVPVAVSVYSLATGGWFTYYLFEVPFAHETIYTNIVFFWREDLLGPLPILAALSGFYYVYQYQQMNLGSLLYYLFAGASLVGIAFQSRLHSGGAANVLIPAYLALAIIGTLGVYELVTIVSQAQSDRDIEVGLWQTLVFGLVLLQLATLVFVPTPWIPPTETADSADRFKHCVSEIDGAVYSTTGPYLAYEAGKEPMAHGAAVVDITRTAGTSEGKRKLLADIRQADETRRFDAVILNDQRLANSEWQSELVSRYQLSREDSSRCGVEEYISLQRSPNQFFFSENESG